MNQLFQTRIKRKIRIVIVVEKKELKELKMEAFVQPKLQLIFLQALSFWPCLNSKTWHLSLPPPQNQPIFLFKFYSVDAFATY